MKAADVRRDLLNLRSRVQSFPPPFLLNVPGVVHGPYKIGRYHLDLNVGHSQKRPIKCGTFMVALGRCLHPHILNKSRGGLKGAAGPRLGGLSQANPSTTVPIVPKFESRDLHACANHV